MERHSNGISLWIVVLASVMPLRQVFSVNLAITDLYNISAASSIEFPGGDSLTIDGKKYLSPQTVIWTSSVYSTSSRIVLFMWDQRQHSMFGWFLKITEGANTIEGTDTLKFTKSDWFNGFAKLEPPLKPARNLSINDSISSSIRCLDRSNSNVWMIGWDWNTKKLTCTMEDTIGFSGGSPRHSFYLSGDSTGAHSGMGVWRSVFSWWQWFPDSLVDSSLFSPLGYDYMGYYKVGSVIPMANGNSSNDFLLITPDSKSVWRLNSGEKWPRSNTIRIDERPVPEAFLDVSKKLTEAGQNKIQGSGEGNPAAAEPPIAVDWMGRVWFAGIRGDQLYMVSDGYFPDQRKYGVTPPTINTVSIPLSFTPLNNSILYIDCSIAGIITITYVSGIETYNIQ